MCKLRCLDLRRFRSHYCLGRVPSIPRNHFDLTPSDDYRKTGNDSILDQVSDKCKIKYKLFNSYLHALIRKRPILTQTIL